jgi:hypothetical protein
MDSPPSSIGSNSSSVMTAEGIFVLHYMDALTSLQKTWLLPPGSSIDEGKFNLQLEYLIRLIPDLKVQEKVKKEFLSARKDCEKDPDGFENQRAGLCVVTHLIQFVCTSFNLLHTDVIGPGTQSEYVGGTIEIPDMPKELATGEAIRI